MTRPDDLPWVFAVRPGIFAGSVTAVSVFLVERLLLRTGLSANVAFTLFVAAFLLVTTLVVTWRIWRRKSNAAAYRPRRPLPHSQEDDWRYSARFVIIGLGTGVLILLLMVWLGLVDRQ